MSAPIGIPKGVVMSAFSSTFSSTSTPKEIVIRLRAAGCVFAEDEARLLLDSAGTQAELAAMIDRRVAGDPLEYVLGWAEFCGLRIEVDPGVFVPRRRTEFLVHNAAALTKPGAVVVDLCCGSGAIGVALAAAVVGVQLHSSDIEFAATTCARRNVGRAGGQVYQGDLYSALPGTLRGAVDTLVANAPYVPSGAIGLMPPEARIYESRVALDGGVDGLDVLRQVAAGASDWLTPGGHLLFEAGASQISKAIQAVADAGLAARVVRSDELNATVIIGAAPPGYPSKLSR